MQVRILSNLAGPKFSAQPGQQIEVDNETADQLISGGFAVPVKTTSIETTELPVIEKAVIKHAKTKGRK